MSRPVLAGQDGWASGVHGVQAVGPPTPGNLDTLFSLSHEQQEEDTQGLAATLPGVLPEEAPEEEMEEGSASPLRSPRLSRRGDATPAASVTEEVTPVGDSGPALRAAGGSVLEGRGAPLLPQPSVTSHRTGLLAASMQGTGCCKRCGEDHPDSVCRDLHNFLRKLAVPKYTQGLPEVEVTFQIGGLSELNVRNNCFSAEFTMMLDWVDPTLHRDTHYTEDYQTQRLQIFPAIEPHIFNPSVVLDNVEAVGEVEPLPGSDMRPQVQAESRRGLHLRRRIFYRGRFSCEEAYSFFPFDSHVLPIRIKTQKWGSVGVVKLCHPRRLGGRPRRHAPAGHELRGEGVHLGDLELFGFGVRMLKGHDEVNRSGSSDLDGTTYEIQVYVRRKFVRHLFILFILCVMVLAGCISFWCAFSNDVLSGRVGINVTILLSAVTFATQRPIAIESVPYNTLYDAYVQFCTCLTAISGFANLVTYLRCFDAYDNCTFCVRTDISDCKTGWCGALNLDCRFAEISFGLLLLYNIYVFRKALRQRHRDVLHWRAACGDVPKGRARRRPPPLSTGEPLFFLWGPEGFHRPHDTIDPSGSRVIYDSDHRRPYHRSSADGSSHSLPRKRQREIQPGDLRGFGSFSGLDMDLHFLDLGSGEIGYYAYRLDDMMGTGIAGEVSCICAGKKEAVPTLAEMPSMTPSVETAPPEQVAEAWAMRLASLREQLVRYIHREVVWTSRQPLGASPTRALPPRRLVIGITGILAFAAENSVYVAERVEEFIGMLEQELNADIGVNWSLSYFVLSKQSEAIFERIAIQWLLASSEMGLTASFAERRELHEYVKLQLTSWALLGGRRYGELDQAEFVEKMMLFSSEPTLERRVMAALEWFRQMDVDNSKSVTVVEMLGFILRAEDLLQAVICKRLFVGTLSGTTSTMQLTVSDPQQADTEVSLMSCSVGNQTPLLQGIFREGQPVRREQLLRWQTTLKEVLNGESPEPIVEEPTKAPALGTTAGRLPGRIWPPPSPPGTGSKPPASPAAGRGRILGAADALPAAAAYGVGIVKSVGLRWSNEESDIRMENEAWPSGLRGIFVGISSMFYAAQVSGIQEQLVAKRVALAALERALEDELCVKLPPAESLGYDHKVQEHQRKMANLAMAHAMIDHVLHEDAFVYFRRQWRMPDSRVFVATWSLGLFLSAMRHSPLNEPTLALARAASRLESSAASPTSVPNSLHSSTFEDTASVHAHQSTGSYWRRSVYRVIDITRFARRRQNVRQDSD